MQRSERSAKQNENSSVNHKEAEQKSHNADVIFLKFFFLTSPEQNMPQDRSGYWIIEASPAVVVKAWLWGALILPKMLATSDIGNKTTLRDKQSWSAPTVTAEGALLFD